MLTRYNFITIAGLALTLMLLGIVATTAADEKKADFLFVQSAKSMSFDPDTNKLTLENVSPVTVFFTDRPERIAGNMKTARFIPFWSEGKTVSSPTRRTPTFPFWKARNSSRPWWSCRIPCSTAAISLTRSSCSRAKCLPPGPMSPCSSTSSAGL